MPAHLSSADELHPDDVPELAFPAGLPGFEELRRFALAHWGPPESPYSRLVSLEVPDVAFLVAPPEAFFDDFDVEVSDDDAALLQLERPEDGLVLVMITVGERVEEATANLLGPLVVNVQSRVGAQLVPAEAEPGRSTRVPLRAG